MVDNGSMEDPAQVTIDTKHTQNNTYKLSKNNFNK